MHQPWYRDERSGEFLMPWVFLHAIKDYSEILWIQSHYPKIKATYNLVPSLIEQLDLFVADPKKDRLVVLLMKDSSTLDDSERIELVTKAFFANPKTMIAPLWRYEELYQKRAKYKEPSDSAKYFSNEELTDLAVLFLIAWSGNQLRRTNKTIKKLLAKQSGFTQEEKLELIADQVEFCKQIVPFYKELKDLGKIDIFTTPFYHPILPLLLDLNSAKASDNNINTPSNWSDFSDDAAIHVEEAIRWYEGKFGTKPDGFWPAEGSVSPKALELLAVSGIKYACTDEDVLFKSLPPPHYRFELYKKYNYKTQNGDVKMLFRDKALSDLIGFNYSAMDAQAAADDFVARLRNIYDSVDFSPVVPVFLDGENAWEFYSNNAFEFFNALYERLEAAPWCKTETISEIHANRDIVSVDLHSIGSGSWIYGSFSTWMGHSEKNRGWELLATAHKDAREIVLHKDKATQDLVKKELMIAEGSDWFWWYGDDHYSPIANEFDELFRGHLIRVYELLDLPVPSALYEPIKTIDLTSDHTVQTAVISPVIDGFYHSYFEWIGSAKLDLSRSFSAMDSSGAIFESLNYGIDGKKFYFQLLGNIALITGGGYELKVIVEGKEKSTYELRLTKGKIDTGHQSAKIKAALQDSLEIELNHQLANDQDRLEISFLLYKQDVLIQRVPLYNTLTLKMPAFDALWYI